jgi:hypothetical protein
LLNTSTYAARGVAQPPTVLVDDNDDDRRMKRPT